MHLDVSRCGSQELNPTALTDSEPVFPITRKSLISLSPTSCSYKPDTLQSITCRPVAGGGAGGV